VEEKRDHRSGGQKKETSREQAKAEAEAGKRSKDTRCTRMGASMRQGGCCAEDIARPTVVPPYEPTCNKHLEDVLDPVWEVVCLAALSAMRFGMSVLYARHKADLEANSKSTVQDGLPQPSPPYMNGGV
jgi:hypothetical protein